MTLKYLWNERGWRELLQCANCTIANYNGLLYLTLLHIHISIAPEFEASYPFFPDYLKFFLSDTHGMLPLCPVLLICLSTVFAVAILDSLLILL